MSIDIIIARAAKLADDSINELRTLAGGYCCDHKPTNQHIYDQLQGLTKGELIGIILHYEFTDVPT